MSTNRDAAVFEITRQFRQTPETVWKAWSEAEQLQKWWGPKGCAINVLGLEFRPGGFFHYAMTFEGAPTMWGRFNYRELHPVQRLVWLNSFANETGGIARAPFSEDCPLEIENTLTLHAADGKTTLRLRATPFGATAAELDFFRALHPSLETGYGGTLDQLALHLQ